MTELSYTFSLPPSPPPLFTPYPATPPTPTHPIPLVLTPLKLLLCSSDHNRVPPLCSFTAPPLCSSLCSSPLLLPHSSCGLIDLDLTHHFDHAMVRAPRNNIKRINSPQRKAFFWLQKYSLGGSSMVGNFKPQLVSGRGRRITYSKRSI